MADYAIYADKLGVREDVPSVLLSEVFLTTESRNIHDEYGEWRKMKGRVPLLWDADGKKIQTPIFYDAVTVVSVGDKKFTIAGLHKTAIDAAIVSSNNQVRINASTDNDGLYTVVSVTEVGGTTTEIVVSEAPTSTTADGNLFAGGTPVINHHNYTKSSTGVDYLLCGTAYHVWLWNDTSKILTLKFTSGTPSAVLDMVMVSHLDYVYMTNNVDLIQWWDTTSTSNSFEDAGSASGIDIDGGGTYITKAKYLYSFKTYLFIGFVTYSTATIYPKRAHWGGRGTGGDDLDFDRNGDSDTNFKDFNHEPSAIVGFGSKDTNLIVAKGESMVKGWLITEATVFEWDEETIKRGCVSGKTLVNDKADRLYYFCNDLTLRELDTPDPISGVIDRILKNINPEFAEYSQATYIDEYKSILFAVPTEGSETNNLVIEFNTIKATCYLHDIPVRAFAGYKRQVVYGYDTLPYDTYEEWGIGWDYVYDTKVNTIGFPLDICSDYNGNTYTLHESNKDDGNDWVGKLVISTTLTPSKSLYVYKRVPNGMDITFNRQDSGTIVVRVKKDTKAWESIGSVNLIGDEDETEDVSISHLPFDKRARVLFFELTSAGNLELLGLVFREFYFDGDR
jgi:hypothetical protein